MDKNALDSFYNETFQFSYSSLNKLLFSPSLFYKDYILKDRELKTDKYLIEGKLVHCLVFEPENLKEKFKIVPDKTPTDSVRKILHKVHDKDKSVDIMTADDLILETLREENLYQTLKEDSARLAKIQTEESKIYWKFIANPMVDVIDQDTLAKCTDYAEIIKANTDVMALFSSTSTDFDLDPVQTYAEKPLNCELKDKPFGLKGIIDFYKVDDDEELVTICDLKTTSKSISDFKETVEFYNYWLQAAIYCKLVFENLDESQQDYNFIYKFVVIDNYKQVYVFDVSPETLSMWTQGLEETLKVADYHYTQRDFSLPYEFLVEKVIL